MKTSAASAHTCVIVGVGAERALGAALCRRFAAEGSRTRRRPHTREDPAAA
jgi:NAD(P)-dependent dehydrogenase (short-subunit alcohol dehydrogenase family)